MPATTRLPPWIRTRLPSGEKYRRIRGALRARGLATVCEEARCPNVAECWGGGTATIMVMGEICTRGCRFCAVRSGRPAPLDPAEPAKTAEMVELMELTYVVLTSVDRDELPDQGANHFAECVRAVHARSPGTLVEVLIPDFRGDPSLLEALCAGGPDVIAHNVETVARLTPQVRDVRAGYRQSLDVLRAVKALRPEAPTKSSIMLGLGETDDELLQTMDDLLAAGVEFLTLGQYLRPTPRHLPVEAFVTPERFAEWAALGESRGFRYVAAGPMVRSSYKAGEYFLESAVRRSQSATRSATQPKETSP